MSARVCRAAIRFDALDGVLRPEPRDEFLNAAPKGARLQDALFL